MKQTLFSRRNSRVPLCHLTCYWNETAPWGQLAASCSPVNHTSLTVLLHFLLTLEYLHSSQICALAGVAAFLNFTWDPVLAVLRKWTFLLWRAILRVKCYHFEILLRKTETGGYSMVREMTGFGVSWLWMPCQLLTMGQYLVSNSRHHGLQMRNEGTVLKQLSPVNFSKTFLNTYRRRLSTRGENTF